MASFNGTGGNIFGLVWTGSLIGVAFTNSSSGTTLRASINNIPITIDDPDSGVPPTYQPTSRISFNNADGHNDPTRQSDSGTSLESGAPARILRHLKTVFHATENDVNKNTGSGVELDLSAWNAVNGQRCPVVAGHFYLFDKNARMWDITYLPAGRSDGKGRPPATQGGTGRVIDIMMGTTQSYHQFANTGPNAGEGMPNGTTNPYVVAPWLNNVQLRTLITNCSNTINTYDRTILTLFNGILRLPSENPANRNFHAGLYPQRRWDWLQDVYIPEGNRLMQLFYTWDSNKTYINQNAYRREMLKTGPIAPSTVAYLAYIPGLTSTVDGSTKDLNNRVVLHCYNFLTPRLPIADAAGNSIYGNMMVINR